MRVDERLGGSLRRAPYVWLVATFLLYLVMNDPLARIAKDTRHASTAVAVVGSVMIAYGIGLVVLLESRIRSRLSADRAATLRWTLAVNPFLLGYAAVAVGGQQWVYALGLVVSLALLVRAARGLRRVAHSS